MGHWLSDYYYMKIREREVLAEAELRRLQKEALEGRPAAPRFYQRWLVRLGNWLMDVGCRIASRYEHLMQPVEDPLPSRCSS